MLKNDIILRPRFTLEVPVQSAQVFHAFTVAKQQPHQPYKIVISDYHIFIKVPKTEVHFWSPQLHLEVQSVTAYTTAINGLFGPSPTVWTFFMFLHTIVATSFLGIAMWGYSNYLLNNSYIAQISIGVMLVLTWFVLYTIGRMGRATGKKQMQQLYTFMHNTLAIPQDAA